MIEADRLIQPQLQGQDDVIDRAMRPKLLDEYTGQDDTRAQLKVFIQAAKNREEALDHMLIYGPPGLGKTTLFKCLS